MKFFLALAFSLFTLSLAAQVYQPNNLYGNRFKRIKIDSTLSLPLDTAIRSNLTDPGAIVYQISDSSLYTFNGSYWDKIVSGSITAALDSAYLSHDTLHFPLTTGGEVAVKVTGLPIANITGLQTALDGKLEPADTSSLSARINSKVSISDTSSMLSPYLRKGDTSSLSTRINLAIPLAQKAVANGVATLGPDGRVPATQLQTGSQVYKGTWDASTNTPTLADGTGTAGWTYRVVTGGTVDLGSGNITFVAGDDVIYNGTVWQKVPSSNAVNSVNGKTGTVVIDQDDVGLGNVDNTTDLGKPISTATQTALNAKANSSVTITAGTGLTGGGNISANRTIAIDPAYASFTNYYNKTNLQTSGQASVHFGNLTNKPTTSGGYGITDAVLNTTSSNWSSLLGNAVPRFIAGSAGAPNGSNWYGLYMPGDANNGGEIAVRDGSLAYRGFTAGVASSWTTVAPASGSANYIQNLASGTQSASSRIDGAYAVFKDGSNSIKPFISLSNAANTRGAAIQLNGDTNPGLSFWVHNGTGQQKRFELFADRSFQFPNILIGSVDGLITAPVALVSQKLHAYAPTGSIDITLHTNSGYGDGTQYRRWGIGKGNTEGSSNVGNDFVITSFDNSGSPISTPLIIKRSSGDISTSGRLNVAGQGRYAGWYTSGGGGLAAEIGVSNSTAVLQGYDRTNSVYVPVRLFGGNSASGREFAIDGTGYKFANLTSIGALGTNSTGYLSDVSGNFIKNQSSTDQTSAFRQTGTGILGSVNTTANTGNADIQLHVGSYGNGTQNRRWSIFKQTAEASGNVGNDLNIGRYDNSGVYLSSPLIIKRSTGDITASGIFTAGGLVSPTLSSSTSLSYNVGSGEYHRFKVNGSEKVTISPEGILAVGNSSPSSIRASPFQVEGNGWSTDAWILGTGNSPTAEFGLSGSGVNGSAFVRTMGTGDLTFQTSANQVRARVNGTTGYFEVPLTMKAGAIDVNGSASISGSGVASFSSVTAPAINSTATLHVAAVYTKTRTINGNGTIANDDYTIELASPTGTGGHYSITLPDPAAYEGRELEFWAGSGLGDWSTNYSLQRVAGPPVDFLYGGEKIKAINGVWKVLYKSTY